MVVDMGAYEFNNANLATTGDGTAGTTLTADLTGKDGLQSYLFLGTAQGEVSLPPFGALFVDLSSFWMFLPLGAIPSSISDTIPPGTPPGIELVFQGLGVQPSCGAGSLSNFGVVVTR